MKKIFKSKKVKKIKIKKILLLLLISFFSAFILSKINIFYKDKVINILKNTSINKIDVSNLKFNAKYFLNVGLSTFDNISFTKEVFKEEKKQEELPVRVYIYNTHQTEEYKTLENYNLTPTVLTAALILKDKLKEYGIGSIVETSDFLKQMDENNYNYYDAYRLSRSWLEKLNNNSLDLYIDLHRDSLNYELSNVVVEGKDYAKIMFVVGTNFDYEKNLVVVNGLLSNIESINKSISRGIFTRKSIYNQDFNKNCVLIELGGPESTYESISNSIDVLSLAIKNYLGV